MAIVRLAGMLALGGALVSGCASGVELVHTNDLSGLCRRYDDGYSTVLLPGDVMQALRLQVRPSGDAVSSEQWDRTGGEPLGDAMLLDITLADVRETGYGIDVYEVSVETRDETWEPVAGDRLWAVWGWDAPKPAYTSPGADGLVVADILLNMTTGGVPWLMGLSLTDRIEHRPARPTDAPPEVARTLASVAWMTPTVVDSPRWRGGHALGGSCDLLPSETCSQTAALVRRDPVHNQGPRCVDDYADSLRVVVGLGDRRCRMTAALCYPLPPGESVPERVQALLSPGGPEGDRRP